MLHHGLDIVALIPVILIILIIYYHHKSSPERKDPNFGRKSMTWKEFKDNVEAKGVKDDDFIDWIDCAYLPVKISISQNETDFSRLVTISDS